MENYTVKTGDTLTSIAKKLTGNSNNYIDIAKYNNITNLNSLKVGLVLKIPTYQSNINVQDDTDYTVQPGDILSELARRYGTDVNTIISNNNISDANHLVVGLKLKLTPYKYEPVSRTIEQIAELESDINEKSNLDIINYYHSKKKNGQYYIVDDKVNNKLHVYKDGYLVRTYPAIHGKNRKSDDMTITKTDSKGKLINLAGNLSTPAGIYFSTKAGMYHGAPSFIRKTLRMVDLNNPHGIPSSIHARTITENANTNGCTGMSCTDLHDLANYITEENVPTYILPADDRNKFFIRNGELQFRSHDINKTPAHNTLVSRPIEKISYDTNGLTDHNISVIRAFSKGLISNKKLLQDKLGINNDTYNKLSKAALGILGVESTYGNLNTPWGNLARYINKGIHSIMGRPNAGSPDIYSKYYTYKINNDNNSIGLTLIRFSQLADNVKLMYAELGITKEDLVSNPEKAAMATLIKLADEYKRLGNNINKAISSWNKKSSYLDMVNLHSSRFNIYEKYKNGGLLKRMYEKQILCR